LRLILEMRVEGTESLVFESEHEYPREEFLLMKGGVLLGMVGPIKGEGQHLAVII